MYKYNNQSNVWVVYICVFNSCLYPTAWLTLQNTKSIQGSEVQKRNQTSRPVDHSAQDHSDRVYGLLGPFDRTTWTLWLHHLDQVRINLIMYKDDSECYFCFSVLFKDHTNSSFFRDNIVFLRITPIMVLFCINIVDLFCLFILITNLTDGVGVCMVIFLYIVLYFLSLALINLNII